MDTTLDFSRLAAICHCSVRQLRGMHARGELPPGVRIGKKYFWRAATVDKWLQGKEAHQIPARKAPANVRQQGPSAASARSGGGGGRKSKAQQVAERRAGGAA